MSLLLDALQRASKDKERAAGTTLQFSEEPGLGASPPPSPAAQPVDALKDLALAPMHPAPAPQPAPAVQTEPARPGPAVSAPLAPAAPPTSEAPSPARAVDPPRVARNLLRAHATAPRPKPNPQVLILGAVALVLAVGLGSLMLGFWDKYFPTDQPVGTLPPAVTPNEATAAMGAASTAAVVPAPAASGLVVGPATAPAKNQPIKPLPLTTASQDTSAPMPSPDGARPPVPRTSGRYKRASESSPTPLFVARTTGPAPLEEAYAALVAGRQDDAARMYGEVLKVQPEERDALLGLAHIAHRAGRRDEAAEYYERVLRQEPDHPVAQAGLLALQARVDPALATSRTRDMAARHPESAAALATLGHLLVKEGRLADASLAFTRAQALEPNNPTHAYNLAVALDQLHQYDKARGYYERALSGSATTSSLEPGFSRAAVQQRLEQLRSTQSGRQP